MCSAWWRAGHGLCAIERGQNLGARCYLLSWCVPSLIVFMAYINPQGFAECQMQCRVQWYKRKWDIWVRLSDSTSQGGKQTQKHWTQMLTFVVVLQRRLSFDSTHWQLCFNSIHWLLKLMTLVAEYEEYRLWNQANLGLNPDFWIFYNCVTVSNWLYMFKSHFLLGKMVIIRPNFQD